MTYRIVIVIECIRRSVLNLTDMGIAAVHALILRLTRHRSIECRRLRQVTRAESSKWLCALPIPLAAEVVVAIRGDLFFRHDQAKVGWKASMDVVGAERRGGRRRFGMDLREVVLLDGAALGAEAEAVVLDFEEGDGVALPGEGFVEDEDRGLHAGVGIETARREGDDGDEVVFDQHLAQFVVGGLALEDDALGHDDAGAAVGREVLGHVVHEQHFAALGLHREAVVRLDAAFRRHEGRVGEDDVGVFVPALLGGERVVFVDVRIGEAVQVEVHQREAHHVGRDVVALEVLGEPALVVRRQGAVALGVGVGPEDVLVGRDQEPGGAAGRVEHGLGLLRVDDLDHEVDDVARGAELPGIALGAEHREQILEGVAQALASGRR